MGWGQQEDRGVMQNEMVKWERRGERSVERGERRVESGERSVERGVRSESEE